MGGMANGVMKQKYPFIPGADICGVVEQVGSKCTRFSVGDHVIADVGFVEPGGLSEYSLVDSKKASFKPENLSDVEAASFPITAITALQGYRQAKLKPGARIMVLGASSGVGLQLIQVAKHAGVSFIGATSTNKELLESLGADVCLTIAPRIGGSPWERILTSYSIA